MSEDFPWYCIRTRNKQETRAARMIHGRVGLKTFAPTLVRTRATRTGKRRFREPLFPCYIFARMGLGEHRRYVEAIEGVRGLVKFGQRTPEVPAEIIEGLRAEMGDEVWVVPEAEVTPGAEVTVISGPFQSLRAIVIAGGGASERVRVLLDILGRSVEAEVDRRSLLVDGDGAPQS